MLKSNINLDSLFYQSGVAGFKNEHLVTAEASNLELGIAHIGLRNSGSNHASAPIFKVQLELSNEIIIFGDVFVNKDGKSLNVRWPQERYTTQDKQIAYADKVRIPTAITAQVLRYAHSRTQATSVQQKPAPAPAAAIPSGKPNNMTPDDFNQFIY